MYLKGDKKYRKIEEVTVKGVPLKEILDNHLLWLKDSSLGYDIIDPGTLSRRGR